MKINLIAILLTLTILAPFAGAAEIRIVTEEYPPYNYTDKGQVTGLSTEVVRAVLAEVKIEAPIQVNQWKNAYALALTEPNVLIYSIGRSADREDQFKWVGEISPPARIFLFALANRVDRGQVNVGSLEDAKAYKIGTTKDDFREQYLVSKGFVIGENLIRAELIHNNMRNLFWGNIDLSAFNELVGYTLAKRLGYDPREIKEVLELDEIPVAGNYMAFSRGTDDEMVELFQTALSKIKQAGIYESIVKKYRKMMLTRDDIKRIEK